MPTVFVAPKKPKPLDRSRMGPLTSFAESPLGVRFETQHDDEKVVLFLRQHFVVNVPWIVLATVLIFAPVTVFPLFVRLVTVPTPAGYLIVGTLFWYIATLGFTIANFLYWYFNIYIVTNERIVDIDFVHLLYKEFSEARLGKIQDVTYRIGGIVATAFNYGNVFIETAGEVPNFEFIAVPNPEKVVKTISELAATQKGHL